MKFNVSPQTKGCLLALGLVLGAAAAHAAKGVTVTPDQEKMVTPGMTAEEVRQTLGRPELVEKFRNESGPTWTYKVQANDGTNLVFDVDFSVSGQVASVSQRETPIN
jgi:outer membrane protein assembly factor BamE (lipoprotein component of BamABCDE complex)